MEVTRMQLWAFFDRPEDSYTAFLDASDDEPVMTEALFAALKDLQARGAIRAVVVGQGMSENHLGGDDLVAAVDDVLAAVRDGYQVISWYGSETEVLVAGYRPGCLSVVD